MNLWHLLTTQSHPKLLQTWGDRREKISTFLNQQRVRNMGSKQYLESQQLHFLKEDLQLKRELFEQGKTLHNEFISEAKKMTTSMDKMQMQ